MSEPRPGNFAHLPFLPAGIAAPYTDLSPTLYAGSFFQGLTEESFMEKARRVRTWTVYTVTPVVFTRDGVTFTTYMDKAAGSVLLEMGVNVSTSHGPWTSEDDLLCNFRRTYNQFTLEPTFGGGYSTVQLDLDRTGGTGDYTGTNTFNLESSRLILGDTALMDGDNYLDTDYTARNIASPVQLHFDPDGDNITKTLYGKDWSSSYPSAAWSGGPIYIKPTRWWTWGGQFNETTGARVTAAQNIRTMSRQI